MSRAYLGQLNIDYEEHGAAQKKFEKIAQDESTHNDPFSQIALGNIWYFTARPDVKEKYETHLDRAFNHYRRVLARDPHNVFAANGLGMVFAERGELQRAREIFAQVCFTPICLCSVAILISASFVLWGCRFVRLRMMFLMCMSTWRLYIPSWASSAMPSKWYEQS